MTTAPPTTVTIGAQLTATGSPAVAARPDARAASVPERPEHNLDRPPLDADRHRDPGPVPIATHVAAAGYGCIGPGALTGAGGDAGGGALAGADDDGCSGSL